MSGNFQCGENTQHANSDSNNQPDAPPSRRRILKGIGVIGAASIIGSGTAVGTELHSLVASSQISAVQTTLLANQTYKLTPSDGDGGELFGTSVSVTEDGTTALVGAGLDENGIGSAYIFDLTQDPPTETKLTSSRPAPAVYFGISLSVSADGSTALVGAPGDVNNNLNTGLVYLFDLTQDPPTEAILAPSDGAQNDYFGGRVSLSEDGSTALIGAPSKDDAGDRSGAAYVYDLTQTPPTETKLTASDASAGDGFGRAVSLNGDGTTGLVGTFSNSVYLYDFTQTPPTETKVTASDVSAGDEFGSSVSWSTNGDTAVVGARNDSASGVNSGSAYVYDFKQSPPSETKLIPEDSERAGQSVSLSDNGNIALVGAPLSSGAGPSSGSAYVYDLTQDPPIETKLSAADAGDSDAFGESVSLNRDGSVALVGAPFNENNGLTTGAVYVYEIDNEVFPETIVLKSGETLNPQDLDGDGLYEDIDGDGDVDGRDISGLTQLENGYRKGEIQLTNTQINALDFNQDGSFTKSDIDTFSGLYGL